MGQAAGVTICKDLNARLPLPKSLDEAEALDKTHRGIKWLDITDPAKSRQLSTGRIVKGIFLLLYTTVLQLNIG